jgi:Icc-related predicted phosphoesterase
VQDLLQALRGFALRHWFFVSDLHGSPHRYRELFRAVADEQPAAVFLGGDLLPSGFGIAEAGDLPEGDFLTEFFLPELRTLRDRLRGRYPPILVILGNDDPAAEVGKLEDAEDEGLLRHLHGECFDLDSFSLFGYAFVPPTPFLLKDWERYDVSRYVPPGTVSPEGGARSVEVSDHYVRYGTIKEDLDDLTMGTDLSRSIFLFHTPPYETNLDRAALQGKKVDHVPLDLHVGSIAVQRFIEARQPLLTLHGHIHESPRIMGSWRDKIGRTHLFSAAHDGPELSLIRFDPHDLDRASRTLL